MRNKKNWRRIMALALSVAMLVSAPMAYAIEVAAEPGMEAYTESGVSDIDDFDIVGGTLNRYTGKATKVVIPEMVTSIGSSAFSGCSGLTEITIPEGVTSIGECAFLGCNSLSKIVLPNQVTRIGYGTFSGCSSLSEIVIPEGVTIIEGEAFSGCSSLGEIIIPKSVTSIETGVFSNCFRLITIKVEEGNTVYDSRENCNAVIETESNMLISGCKNTIIPEEVTSIRSSAFAGCNDLTEIVIPERVTSIGDSAFSDCSSLTEIVIPEGVTSIGSSAFSGCSSLTEIVIPKGVTSIGSSAFSDCISLTAIKVEEGNSVYDSRENCNAVIEIESNTLVSGCKNTIIPEGVTNIGGYAFKGCSGLTEIVIPEGVTSIGFETFRGCSSLMGITIPNSVTVIGQYAFTGCRSLTEIVIPKGLTSIGESAFRDCSSMVAIKVEEGNPVYDSRKNCNAIIETESNTLISGCKNTVIPEEVTGIGRHAFSGSDLTEIVISERVTSIAVPVFRGCSSLSVIKVEEGNPVYDSRENCNAIIETKNNTLISGCKNTIIPEGVTRIGDSAFYECRSLTEIVIPEGVTSMGQCVFSECSSLVGVTIPESVTSIDYNVFSQCSEELTIYGKEGSYAETYAAENNIKFSAGEMSHPGEEKNKCGDNLTWRLDSGGKLTISGTGEMYDFSINTVPWKSEGQNIKSVVIEEGATSIGDYAFYGCSSLTEIVIPNSVTGMGECLFDGCSNLKEIVIPNGVTSIGNATFSECSSLMEIVIPDGVTSIGGYAFHGCSSLTEIVIPDGVTSIGERAFTLCSSLTEIKIPKGITSIENAVFDECSSLKEIVIPSGVANIGANAFSKCSSLTKIVIPEGVTDIGNAAFALCSNLTEITIPKSVTSVAGYVFFDCSSLSDIYYGGTQAQWEMLDVINSSEIPDEQNVAVHCQSEMPDDKDISNCTIILSNNDFTYIGKAIEPNIIVIDSGSALRRGTDYVITYSGNINAGEATITVKGIGKYTGMQIVPFTIEKAAPTLKFDSSHVLKLAGDEPFINGLAIEADGQVTFSSDNTSVANVNASSGLISIQGEGSAIITASAAEGINYTAGTASYVLTVYPAETEKNIDDCTVSLSENRLYYDGTAKHPEITLLYDGVSLAFGTDYTVRYFNNINAGTATAQLEGVGQYTGIRNIEFTIYKAAPTLQFASANVKKTLGDADFTNKLTVNTDGKVTYSSGNSSVATVNESSGLVTLKGAGTATITANAAEGENYTSKSVSYKLTVSQPPSADLSSLTYSFGNSNFAFGYSASYQIPLSSYQMVFSDIKAKSLFDNLGGVWGGSCYGMSSTSGIFNVKNSGMVVGDFNAAANKVSDLKVADKNNKLNIALQTWIEAMHVSQYDSSVQRCFAYNEDLDSMCAEVNRGLPVIIGMWRQRSGHAIVGYKVEKISATKSYLYVYDCNFPNQTRMITLTTDRLGNCTGWYYHLNDIYDWGSADSECSIAYVPYSCYQAMWENSPAARRSVMPFTYKIAALSNLTGEVSVNQNMLMVNSDEFSIQDQNGTVVAEVKNGQLTAGKQGIYQFRPTDLMLDDEKKDSEEKIMIYLPTDAYMIKSTDDS